MPYEIVTPVEREPEPVAEIRFDAGTLQTDADSNEISEFVDRVNEMQPWETKGQLDDGSGVDLREEGPTDHTEDSAISRLESILARNGYGLRATH